ncbi:MAG: DUF4292 domain-containing protein [Bacteroidota bacterium]
MSRNNSVAYSWMGLVMLCMFWVGGCKNLKDSTRPTTRKSPEVTLEACKRNNISGYKTISISGKGKIDYPDGNIKIGASYRINMYNDSLIWISVRVLGFEGVRVLITEDSVYVLNRQDKTLTVSDYRAVNDFLGQKANISKAQDLILGNLLVIPEEVTVVERRANPRVYKGRASGTDFAYEINTEINKLVEVRVRNEILQQNSRLQYTDFEFLGRQRVPKAGNIKVTAPTEATLMFKHSKMQLDNDKVTFKFNVPGSYERISG